MVRFAAFLVMLVACNAGPLQWSDATTWQASDAGWDCVRDVASDAWSADACRHLLGRTRAQRAGRVVTGRPITAGADTCLAALRDNDTVEPSTCVVPTITVTRDDGSWTRYAIILRASTVQMEREVYHVRAHVTWTMEGTVLRSVGDSYPIRATYVTSSTFAPVR